MIVEHHQNDICILLGVLIALFELRSIVKSITAFTENVAGTFLQTLYRF